MITTREDWLNAAVEHMRPLFIKHKLELPPKISVSCGFPSKGGISKERRTTGETWPSTATFDATVHVFVSPLEDEPHRVIGILARQLIQAALPDDAGFGPNFKAACSELGFEGHDKHAMPGIELQTKHLDGITDLLNEYPHAHLILAEKQKLEKPKKKTTFKLFCPFKRACDSKKCFLTDKSVGEDYGVSISNKKLSLGYPSCPCSQTLEMEEEDFKLYQDQQKEIS